MFYSKLRAGFSLIELMIVIAIIGILAAIAIPAYGDYIVRTQVSEVFQHTSSLKQSASAYRTVKGAFPTTLAAVGVTDPSNVSPVIKSVAVSNPTNASTDIRFTYEIDPAAADVTDLDIVLTGTYTNGGVTWVCTSASTATPSDVRFAPATCR